MNKIRPKIILLLLCIEMFIIPTITADASAKVRLSLDKATIGVGKTVKLKVHGANKNNKIRWKSSNKKVASVSGTGLVKGRKAGTAVVTAKYGKKTFRCKVSVKKRLKTLVVYFSRTGTTKQMAKRIQKLTNADLFSIKVKDEYPDNYSACLERAMKELNEDARPQLANRVKNMKSYDVVFIGFPIWHGTTPRPVNSFLESYNWSGKTVVPFCTSGGSDIDEASREVKKMCENAIIKKGIVIEDASDIRPWLKRIDIM